MPPSEMRARATVNPVLVCFAAIALFAVASCSARAKDIYPVSGEVLCQGQPAVGAVVFFNRHGGAVIGDPSIMGIVRQDGRYELVSGSQGSGAPAGDYDVMIQWPRPSPHRGGSWRMGADRLAGRFSDPTHPMLRARIEARPNELPPFEIRTQPGIKP
jgi:hypothetical protein